MQFELYKNHTKNNTFGGQYPKAPTRPSVAPGLAKVRRAAANSALALASLLFISVTTADTSEHGGSTTLADCPLPGVPGDFYRQSLEQLDTQYPAHTQWQDPERLRILYEEIDRLRIDGLQPLNYYLSEIGQLEGQLRDGGPLDPCQAGLVSYSYLRSLGELAHGRLEPAELGVRWYREQRERSPEPLLELATLGLTEPKGLREAYRLARPALDLYQDLREAHRQARQDYPVSWPEVRPGGLIRPGQNSDRIPEITERLLAQNYLSPEDTSPENPHHYGSAIEAAVRAFQRDFGLRPDGLIGPATTRAFNEPPATWLAIARANLERLRWLNRDLPDEVLLVDIAGARVEYRDQGEVIWRGKAQVGRPERKTPEVDSVITHVTLNPTWTIPPTIFYKDTLPAVQRDPDYLANHRIRVLDRDGREIPADQVDWSRPGRLILRQDAGQGNALGQVAIRFPNPFSVYLHDTPSVWLFDTPSRFYSSGCVRVENAMDLARTLFRQADSQRRAEFEQILASGRTRNLNLPAPVPVVMAYWTAEGDRDGNIRFREDIYEEDTVLIDLLEDADR